MKTRVSRFFFLFALVCGIVLFILVYSQVLPALSSDFQPAPTELDGLAIDPVFKEFYQTLGGAPVLGNPLTHLFERESKSCQYTEAALMCFDPNEVDEIRRFSLDPLGVQLGVREDARFSDSAMGSRDLGNGFVLYEEFSAVYDRMFGALYTGKPLTQVRIDKANQRYVQFFENVGFYRGFDETPGTAHLIPYGSYLCGPECSKNLDQYWSIIQSAGVEQPFELSVSRLGWVDLGAPLTQPHLNEDGTIDQVYDNVVLYAPHDDLSQVRFRPLVSWLHLADGQPLVARTPHEQLVFYEVAKGLGHNVPLFFDKFIATHGGRDLSGQPMSELVTLQAGRLYRQCFESYCLEYDAAAPEGMRVRMSALGDAYVRATDPSSILRQAFSPDTVLLQVEEDQPQLGAGEEQRITMHVFHRANGQPMYLVEGTVAISKPGRPVEIYHFKPSDETGTSTVVIPPLTDVPAMSVVEYQVCLNLPGDPKMCSTDSFLYRGE